MSKQTLIVSQKEAEELLLLSDCIPLMEEMLKETSNGNVRVLQRSMLHHENGNILALMPATIDSSGITGSKVIIFPGPEARKNHTNQGIIPIFDVATGGLKAIIDGECITTIRTAATSAAATDALARKDSHTIGILGAGKLGRAHLEAISLIRPIQKAYIWDLYPGAVEAYVRDMSEKLPHIEIIPCTTPEAALRDADIICTVTKAAEPIVFAENLKVGVHINAVGACSATAREMATDVMQKARIFVDRREISLRDAGDLVIPINAGELTPEAIIAEVGEVLLGQNPGRISPDEVTLFETVGISAQDLASADLIYQKAIAANKGVWVTF